MWVQRNDRARRPVVVHDHCDGRCEVPGPGLPGPVRGAADYGACQVGGWDYVELCGRFGGGVPAWYRHATWTGPQRARVRDACRAAVLAINGRDDDGDLDEVDLPVDDHRHRAASSWF